MTALGTNTDIADLLEVEVPVGGRALVVADLRMGRDPSAARLAAEAELASAIEAATGPGVLVVAGDLLESAADAKAALSDHFRLVEAISDYSKRPGRQVVVCPGEMDVALAWSEPLQGELRSRLGARLALAVSLRISTGAGLKTVRVEPGFRFDPLSRYDDPRNPGESPISKHLREDLLPAISRRHQARGKTPAWLAGMEAMDDPAAFSRFVASRLVYHRLARSAWLLLAPVVAALALRVPAAVAFSRRHGALGNRVGLLLVATTIEVAILAALALVTLRRTSLSLSSVALGEPEEDRNEAPRAHARELVTSGQWCGLVTGHTCRPELTTLGGGFYANAGAVAELVTELPCRMPSLGLPSIFLPRRLISWVEIEAGNELHVRLLFGQQLLPGATLVERALVRRDLPSCAGELRAQVVASLPGGGSWPPPPDRHRHHHRVRRASAAVSFAMGFISLVSAVSDPLRDRLDLLRSLFPLYVPQAAGALAAFGGVGLMMLARGIRRGQRRAWAVAELLLLAVALLHLIKGVEVELAAVAATAAGFLWLGRDSFRARTDTESTARGLLVVAVAAVATLAAGTIGVELSGAIDRVRHRPISIPWLTAFKAVLGRAVGDASIPLPPLVDRFVSPAMLTATAGLVCGLAWVLFRPVARRTRRDAQSSSSPGASEQGGSTVRGSKLVFSAGRGDDRGPRPCHPTSGSARSEDMSRARLLVARYGSGTLDYFALRSDKELFFWGDTLVAYAVYGGVCLVSPDPVGPPAEREEAWRAFRRYVDQQGWALGGLGMGEEWLPMYRASGMRDLYVGDEAIVRAERFSLEGGRHKGLRQAVNRVAKYGYSTSFWDPANLPEELRCQLRRVMTKSRRGEMERGFSMTLGRAFDPSDKGLLLTVVHSPKAEPAGAGQAEWGTPVAFCQYVPAPGINGYSLDLMRRDDGEHPNGLIDFAVVRTIGEIRARGGSGLGLNFATMRAVLAGEAGEGLSKRVGAWALRRLGGSMQIESLWRFNAKYDPDWQPRYAIYDAPENLVGVGLAIARAESFWELPVIGRFLTPSPEEQQA